MTFRSFTLFLLAFYMIFLSSCSKTSFENFPITTPQDTTITDTSIYIDVTINSTRYLGIAGHDNWAGLWGGGWEAVGDNNFYDLNRLGSIFGNLVSPFTFYCSKGNQYLYIDTLNTLAAQNPPQTGFIMPLPAVSFAETFFNNGNYNYASRGNDTTYSKDANFVIPTTTKTLLTDGISICWQDSSHTL